MHNKYIEIAFAPVVSFFVLDNTNETWTLDSTGSLRLLCEQNEKSSQIMLRYRKQNKELTTYITSETLPNILVDKLMHVWGKDNSPFDTAVALQFQNMKDFSKFEKNYTNQVSEEQQETRVFSDESNFETLRASMSEFAAERNWDQYHTPRNLVLALVGEVGELAEIFQWTGEVSKEDVANWDAKKREHLGEEMSDVLLYLIRLADRCTIDLPKAAQVSIIAFSDE